MIEYSAGIVTAYGSAVRAGYTGTYEDFCRQQAQYADNASAVEQAKQTAVSSAQTANQAKQDAQTASTTAQQSAQSASQSAQLAGQSAQDAQTAKNNAQTYAQSASQSAGSAQAVLESIPEDYSDLSEDVTQLKADLFPINFRSAERLTTGDFNEIITPGNYYITSSGDASNVSNTPVNVAGRLVVFTTTSANTVEQIYLDVDNKIYHRRYNVNGWTSWLQTANTSSTLTLDSALATNITSGNLNDYKTYGNYRVNSSSIAANIENMPKNAAGRLLVLSVMSNNVVEQIYISADNMIFARHYDANGWTAWDKIATNNDVMANALLLASNASTIISNGDLNTYTSHGTYRIGSSSSAVAIENTPVNEGGKLVVMTLAGPNNAIQIYFSNSGTVFRRKYDANGWSDWNYYTINNSPVFTGTPTAPTAPNGTASKQIATTEFVANLVNSLGNPIALKQSVVTGIPSGSDLDDYTTAGNHKIATGAISQTIIHIPVKDAGRLIVMTTVSDANIVQIYVVNNGRVFMRKRDASGWSEWLEFVKNDSNYKETLASVERLKASAERLKTISNGLFNVQNILCKIGTYDIGFANSPAPLILENYVGNTQNVHPKVLYFENGFGGHAYWMAYTPYPNGYDIYENPCIAYSDDGYTWTNISGNPLDDPNRVGYNSDTHLVYREEDGVMEVWYRYVTPITDDKRYELIYRQNSQNGVDWSEKELVYECPTAGATHVLSPAVIWDGEKYMIWVVDSPTVTYYEASPNNITQWTKVRTYPLSFVDSGKSSNAWHLDVIKDGDTYIMLVMCMGRSSPRERWSLFLSTSQDNITYSNPKMVLKGSDNWDHLIYRSCIVKVSNRYRIYYSTASKDLMWGMGISESDTLDNFIGKLI